MWGSWFAIVIGGVLVLLLLVGIAFGTAALLFPVLIAGTVAVVAAGVAILRRAGAAEEARGRRSDPRAAAAPASGEGSGSPHSSTGPVG